MNWYKLAEKESRLRVRFRRIQDDYSDDGVKIWTKSDDVFVSFGDWAESKEEVLYEIERFVRGSGKVDWDYEVGSPGAGWSRV